MRRPRLRAELSAALIERAHEDRRRTRSGSFRLAFVGALTVAMLTALAAFGGLGYAASTVSGAVASVAHLVAPSAVHDTLSATSGSDQYRPGFGWGDKNHNHTGPPGAKRKGGALAPPLRARFAGSLAFVSTALTLDEQAHLTISVTGPDGKEITLVQNDSKIGAGIKGPNTKNLQYLVLIPRTLPLKLALPANSLVPGTRYTISIRARDPDNNVKNVAIPFIA